MGNVVSPAKTPKVTKLKSIVYILVEQQRKIKRSKQESMRKQRQVHMKMKNTIARKSEKKWSDVGIEDDIREMAEEMAYLRNRILDLKVCVDTLRSLQYKVQSILNAYYTHTTLLVVNNAIKKTNIAVEKLDKDQGETPCGIPVCNTPCGVRGSDVWRNGVCAGVQDLIDELLKTKEMNLHVRPLCTLFVVVSWRCRYEQDTDHCVCRRRRPCKT